MLAHMETPIPDVLSMRRLMLPQRWSDEKLIGANVTFAITDITISGDSSVVTAEVDGDFDKTGLPDPFVMALHFVISGSKIVRLAFHLPEE